MLKPNRNWKRTVPLELLYYRSAHSTSQPPRRFNIISTRTFRYHETIRCGLQYSYDSTIRSTIIRWLHRVKPTSWSWLRTSTNLSSQSSPFSPGIHIYRRLIALVAHTSLLINLRNMKRNLFLKRNVVAMLHGSNGSDALTTVSKVAERPAPSKPQRRYKSLIQPVRAIDRSLREHAGDHRALNAKRRRTG